MLVKKSTYQSLGVLLPVQNVNGNSLIQILLKLSLLNPKTSAGCCFVQLLCSQIAAHQAGIDCRVLIVDAPIL
jgi:hypothetical protein